MRHRATGMPGTRTDRHRRSGAHRLTVTAIVAGSIAAGVGLGSPSVVGAAAPPTPVVGLSSTGALVRFDASVPGTVSAPVAITGLQPAEQIVGFDVRPATGELIGIGVVGTEGRVYVVNPASGAATQIGT